MKKIKLIHKIILFLLLSTVFTFNKALNLKIFTKKIKRVGVVNLPNGQNIGNILVKFSMFKKLEEMSVNSTIIIPHDELFKYNISFLNNTIKSHLFIVKKNFSELNEKDFDYLMVNSDQTWVPGNFFIDIPSFTQIKKFLISNNCHNLSDFILILINKFFISCINCSIYLYKSKSFSFIIFILFFKNVL